MFVVGFVHMSLDEAPYHSSTGSHQSVLGVVPLLSLPKVQNQLLGFVDVLGETSS